MLKKLNPCAACESKRHAILSIRCPDTGWQVFIDCQVCGGSSHGVSVHSLKEALNKAAIGWNCSEVAA